MELDEVRTMALALRDLVVTTPAIGGSLTLDDAGTTLGWDREDGFHLIPANGAVVDISDEWAEYEGLSPVDGVTSVRQQMATRASVAK